MPVLHRCQQVLAPRHSRDDSDNIDTIEKEQMYIVEEDYEHPQKEMDFPITTLTKMTSRSRNQLRIDTYSQADLLERYLSSEEEPSPSPSSDIGNHDKNLQHESPETLTDDTADLSTLIEYKAEIAIAVPILALGRPRLVDITSLAPMHKRKRDSKPLALQPATKKLASRLSTASAENTPLIAKEAVGSLATEYRQILSPKRKDSLPPMPAPDSWLPDENLLVEDDNEHYFPLDVRPTPAYRDYDPYSLKPPRLSSTDSLGSRTIARTRGNSNSPLTAKGALGWKGLTRSLSLAKKSSAHKEHQVMRKSKMVARGANEREETCMIPPFPSEDDIPVA